MEVSGRRQIGSDDLSLCDPCKWEDEDENAVCYCTVCNAFLCDICTNAHKRVSVSKHHQLLDRDSMPTQKFRSSVESMCTKHSGKLVEYFFNIHDDCSCSVCATIEHKHCKVEYIDDIATEFEKCKEYKALMSVIADLTQLLQNTKKTSLKKKDDLEIIHGKFVLEVKKNRAEINRMLDSLEQSTLMHTHTVRYKDTKPTDAVSTKCDTMIADLEKMSNNIETQNKYKQQRQFMISAKKAQNQIKQYVSIIAELNNQYTIQEYCFRPNEISIQSIKVVNSLGHVDDIKLEQERNTKPEKKTLLTKVREFYGFQNE